MSEQPLQSFSAHNFSVSYLADGASVGSLTKWTLLAVISIWIIYTLIVIYHWLKYSHASWVAFPAILTHLGVSLILILFTLYGTFTI